MILTKNNPRITMSFSVICFVVNVCILIVACYMFRKCDLFCYGGFKEFEFFPVFGSFTTGYCAIESTSENNMIRRIFLRNRVYFRRLRVKKTETFPPLDGTSTGSFTSKEKKHPWHLILVVLILSNILHSLLGIGQM